MRSDRVTAASGVSAARRRGNAGRAVCDALEDCAGCFCVTAGAMRTVHARRSWLSSVGWSLLSDATDLLLVALCLRAFGIDVPPAAWALVLFSVNLAILLPSTPGQVGVLEAGGVLALTMAGVPPAPALAFALAYHAVHLVPTTALGLAGLCLPWRQS